MKITVGSHLFDENIPLDNHPSIDELIDIVLNQYKHHSGVVGFGIDVEWYKSTNGPEGHPITGVEAKRWVTAVRRHDPDYQLFRKHWKWDRMLPTDRGGIFFVDDSQQFKSLDQILNEFDALGEAFAPAPCRLSWTDS